MERVLVLNYSFEPLHVINWQRAVVLLWQKKTEVLVEQETVVHSPNWQFKVPSVMRLLEYVKHRIKKKVPFTRNAIYQRDDFTCQYCVRKMKTSELAFDHIVPRTQGGKTTWTNIATCCFKCNTKKGGRTPQEARMKLANVPTEPKWQGTLGLKFEFGNIPKTWRDYVANFSYWNEVIDSE